MHVGFACKTKIKISEPAAAAAAIDVYTYTVQYSTVQFVMCVLMLYSDRQWTAVDCNIYCSVSSSSRPATAAVVGTVLAQLLLGAAK